MPEKEADINDLPPGISENKRLFIFEVRDLFDLRYVLKEGEYKLFRTLIISAVGLMLSTVFIAILALVVHAGSK